MVRFCAALVVVGGLLVGCEQKTEISGKVTYNGEPVDKGSITFKPNGAGGRSFGAPITDGAYSADQAQPGNWTAIIIGVKKIDFAMSSEEAARKANESNATPDHLKGQVSEAADYIPEDADGNSKAIDIAAGKQTIDFDVKGPPRS